MLPKKENLYIEFKSDTKKYPDSDIFEAIVAFANTSGGDLYLGIEDDGTVTGVHKDHKNPISLSAYIANNTIPPVSIRAEIIDDIFPVLKISVPQSYSSIIATTSGKVLRRRLKPDGTPQNIPMYPSEFATRLSDLRLLDYSALPIEEATLDDFNLTELEKLRNIILAYKGDQTLLELTNEELYKALGFVREIAGKIVPTITGLLLIGKPMSIKKYIPTSSASFQVLDGTETRINEDFNLPLLSSIEKIYNYMDAWNPEEEIEHGLFRMSVSAFDKRAIRESVVNAFSHRDYTKMGRIRIMINDEGLTISNPGGFIEGISINNLLCAEPHGRNPQLADALKRIGLAERTGRGIDRIFEGSLLFGKPLPDYSNSNTMNVSLFIPRSKSDIQLAQIIANEQNRIGRPLSINMLLVLNTLKDMPKSSISQIHEVINISESTIKNSIDKAIEYGLVDGYGNGRGRTYILSTKLYKSKNKKMGYVRQVDIDESRHLELIINMAKSNDFISRADVINLLHVSEDSAYKLLKELVDKNTIVLVCKGRYAKYKLKK